MLPLSQIWPLLLLWASVIVVLVVIEAMTLNLVTIWFAVGALASLITCLFTTSFQIQLLVFAVVSVVALIASKPFISKLRHAKPASPVGLERNIGRRALVLIPIHPGEHGRVRLDGVDWQAISDSELAAGDACTICDVQSTTLKVQPVQSACPKA